MIHAHTQTLSRQLHRLLATACHLQLTKMIAVKSDVVSNLMKPAREADVEADKMETG